MTPKLCVQTVLYPKIIFQLEKQIQLWMKFDGFDNVSINITFGKERLKKHNKVKLMQIEKTINKFTWINQKTL